MDIICQAPNPKFCVLVYGKYDLEDPYNTYIQDIESICVELGESNSTSPQDIHKQDRLFLEKKGITEEQKEYLLLVNLIQFYEQMKTRCMMKLGVEKMFQWGTHFFLFYRSYSSPNFFEILQYRMYRHSLCYIPWHFPINLFHLQQFSGCVKSKFTLEELHIEDAEFLLNMPTMVQDIWLCLLECLVSWKKKFKRGLPGPSGLIFCQMANEAKLNFVRT